MTNDFPQALAYVLQSEGGYVNDPQDPGGATNHGVTQNVYNHYRAEQGMSSAPVRSIADNEVADIYRHEYWRPISGDALPQGLDYCVFDFAVNSGVVRAAKFIQRIVGVDDDGQIGNKTIGAMTGFDTASLIDSLCDARLSFLQKLPTWSHFGEGWTNRIDAVREQAKELANA